MKYEIRTVRRVVSVLLSLSFLAPSTVIVAKQGSWPPEFRYRWKLVASEEDKRMVYVQPEGLRDDFFIAQVLLRVTENIPESNPIEVYLFDSVQHTPARVPMTEQEKLHFRAFYQRRSGDGREHFEWITVVDRNVSPVVLERRRAGIRPGEVK